MNRANDSRRLPSWRLDRLYPSLDSTELQADLRECGIDAQRIFESSVPHDTASLERLLLDIESIRRKTDKISLYARLIRKVRLDRPDLQTKAQMIIMRIERLIADRLRPTQDRLTGLPDRILSEARRQSTACRRLMPWLDIQRYHRRRRQAGRSRVIPETSRDAALAQQRVKHIMAGIRVSEATDGSDLPGLSLSQCTDLLNCSPDRPRRLAIQSALDSAYRSDLAEMAAKALQLTVLKRRQECSSLGYDGPMQPRNRMNGLSDRAVRSLHQAVNDVGPGFMKRQLTLKARLMSLTQLTGADLNVPVFPGQASGPIDYQDGCRRVVGAFRDFSPYMGQLARKVLLEGRVDARPRPGKSSGACNLTAVIQGEGPVSFVLLSWYGQERNLETLAHEMGHAVRGLAAGAAQGPLLFGSSVVLSETAAVFAEGLLFASRLAAVKNSDSPQARLRLLIGRMDSLLSTTVRQIALSNFEQDLHRFPEQANSAEAISRLWVRHLQPFYGRPGDRFDYEGYRLRWATITHFHRPFAVYGYSAAELLANAIRESGRRLGPNLPRLYMRLMANGQSLPAAEALAPFGIDPEDPAFWRRSLNGCLGPLIERIEELAEELLD